MFLSQWFKDDIRVPQHKTWWDQARYPGFKSDFKSLSSNLKNENQSKFENTRLNQTESNLENNITEQVNKSILSAEDSIITALRNDSKMLQVKVEILEKKLEESEKSFHRLDQ